MKETIKRILTDLERVRENLLALSDDIWLSIDHNDADALQQGYEFKVAYNSKLQSFDKLATELSVLTQQFTHVRLESSDDSSALVDHKENQRIIKELDREQPHSLDEDFRYKRPYGFVLAGWAVKDVATWRQVYVLVCRHLAKRDPVRFKALPDNPDYVTNRGNRDFSRSPDDLRSAHLMALEMYAEVNFSANMIRGRIAILLRTFGIPAEQMKIYLREDRDAGDE